MSRWPRPARPRAPIAVAVAVLATWWLVAHSGGAGWVQALGDVAFGTLLVGIAGPALALMRAKVSVCWCEEDTTAGELVEIELQASARVRIRPVSPPGQATMAGPARGGRAPATRMRLRPERRGTYDAAAVRVESAAPFGLQWWARPLLLTLPTTLHVAPRRGTPREPLRRSDDEPGDSAHRAPADSGEPRGVRPYRPGDRWRHVHWPATAHTGELVVRELDLRASEPATVSVRLPRDPDSAERVAEQALGTVLALLGRDGHVRVLTVERGGQVEGLVSDRRAAGRRLARAVPAGGDPEAELTVFGR